ncbi:hypothetical protein B0T14DRAFT_602930 [Immersiella caudata]|uniref:Uncharacterized protein n=1 Tax=Immersiella caudata TaxID=314043 RepID=A0AA39WP54_9PEZI|nr:hypothetical protein B0T14DRAFT_602930 [Immersiella caudata]
MGVDVFLPPARVLQALLAVNLAAVVCFAVLTWTWRSGIATPPGTIATVSALSRSSTLRGLFYTIKIEHGSSGSITDADMVKKTESYRFMLSYYRNTTSGGVEYGTSCTSATKSFILDCCGVLIACYNATVEPDTGFERFMIDQNFGVRLFFTTFGVLLTFF